MSDITAKVKQKMDCLVDIEKLYHKIWGELDTLLEQEKGKPITVDMRGVAEINPELVNYVEELGVEVLTDAN